MFLGHFALAFGAKRFSSKLSLGLLFIAAQLLDLLWPVFLLLGLERALVDGTAPANLLFVHYPYSHSLLFVLVWAIIFGICVYAWSKNLRAALICGILVASHWVLDVLVHSPDLPLFPGSVTIGLGWWNFPLVALLFELILFAIGVWWYVQASNVRGARRYGLVALVFLLVVIHLANVFGPPPPSIIAVAWAGNLLWLFVLLAFWVDGKEKHVQ